MRVVNNELLISILDEIKENSEVTEKYLAEKYFYNERTVRRYIKILKDRKIIKLENNGKKRKWVILK